jgi:sigma-B regulation protein RsbQ
MNFEFETANIHFTMEGCGPPLIFLHGLGGRAENWLYQRRYFAKTRTVICPDMPGHGRSTGREISFIRYADVLVGLLDSLHVTSCEMVGLSKGARVGLSLAARLPHRVSGLVLVNTFVCLTPEDRNKREKLYALLSNADGGQEWARQLVAEMGLATDSTIARGFIRALDTIDPEHIRRIFLEVIAHDQRSELAKVTAPVLVLRGEADHFVPTYCATYLRQQLHRSEHSVMRDCGHLPYLERPEEFNRVVEAFLDRNRRPDLR